jgi:hypothetical protein
MRTDSANRGCRPAARSSVGSQSGQKWLPSHGRPQGAYKILILNLYPTYLP